MPIQSRYCKTLELDKILARLADCTCCDAAREKALSIQPYTNPNLVEQSLDKTADAFTLSAQFGTPHFSNLSDPAAALTIAQKGGSLSLVEFLRIRQLLRQVRGLTQWYAQCAGVENSLQELFAELAPNQALEKAIDQVVVSEEMVNDYASSTLADLRRKIASAQAKAKQEMDKIIRSSKYQKALQENLITQRDGRFVVPVKAEHKSEIPGLVHDSSASGATLFVEPMGVVEANNQIRVLQTQEKAEIQRILYELSQTVAEHARNLMDNFEVVIALNLCFAKAELAAQMNAQKPRLTDTGEIVLNKARHPLLDPKTAVPISLTLGGDCRTLVITGPNTGGKTVTLKTIGLLCLMTMCGLLIPVGAGSTMSVFDQVLADIGDEQSIEQSLSTFSAHMTNLVHILKTADDHSLILTDELGSGTDPVEGAALAIAVLEALRQRGAVTAATTHYPELKVYAIETAGVENACCEFDVDTLKPTYRLLIGVPGRSNAFAISRRLGLDEGVLQKAESLVDQENKQLETTISRLETQRQEYEKQFQEYQSLTDQLKQKNSWLEEQRQELEEEKKEILDKAQKQAAQLVNQVKAQSDRLLNELDALKKEKDAQEFAKKTADAKAQLRRELQQLDKTANPVQQRSNKEYKLPRPIRKGDTVLIFDIDKKGTALEDSKGKTSILVQAGLLKSRVKISNLRLLEEKNPYAPKKPQYRAGGRMMSAQSQSQRRASMELDLRGETVEEALMELDQFLDNCVMANQGQVTIIHGKGTGALRKAVQQHLKHHPSVKSYRLGVFGEGESGVTIVELK